MSCIKSIQRGIGNASTTSFTINKVDPDKCIVLIDGIVTSKPYGSVILGENYEGQSTYITGTYSIVKGGATIETVTETTLTFSNVQNEFSWQIIEFS